MTPAQADKLIWISDNATQEEYELYWDEVQKEHGHSDEKMGVLLGYRYALNEAFKEGE